MGRKDACERIGEAARDGYGGVCKARRAREPIGPRDVERDKGRDGAAVGAQPAEDHKEQPECRDRLEIQSPVDARSVVENWRSAWSNIAWAAITPTMPPAIWHTT